MRLGAFIKRYPSGINANFHSRVGLSKQRSRLEQAHAYTDRTMLTTCANTALAVPLQLVLTLCSARGRLPKLRFAALLQLMQVCTCFMRVARPWKRGQLSCVAAVGTASERRARPAEHNKSFAKPRKGIAAEHIRPQSPITLYPGSTDCSAQKHR